MQKTNAVWNDNMLMVRWYGSKELEEAAFWELRKGADGRIGTLHFDGCCQSLAKRLYEKPSAQEALAIILNWQFNG